jgi:hypothetical protein
MSAELNDRGLPVGYRDAVYVDVTVKVGWPERLRILWHGTLHLYVKTFCEHEPGKVRSETEAVIPALFPKRPSGGLYVISGETAPEEKAPVKRCSHGIVPPSACAFCGPYQTQP